MNYKFDKNSHSVYTLNYHLVQCIKYRKKIFDDKKIINELKERTITIAKSYDIEILSIETDLDHVHILFKTKPQTNIIKFVNNWKSATSKSIQNRYRKKIEHKLWNKKFWSKSYCLITTGQTTLSQIKKYVENQGEKRNANNS